ncbi:MAG: translation initiation factor Sui1 [Planctomycetes bacterium]|nr:translation initiation factor Sui1 [Planctomycetota bacterium]
MSRIVWSSSGASKCLDCGKPAFSCKCKDTPKKKVPAGDGIVRVGRETKGRKGKGVTVVSGVPLAGSELDALAKRLKTRCASGGTVRDGVIEIQGDHRDTLVPLLEAEGFTVKRVGG